MFPPPALTLPNLMNSAMFIYSGSPELAQDTRASSSSKFTCKWEDRTFYCKYKVLLLFLHNSHGLPELTDCGILTRED